MSKVDLEKLVYKKPSLIDSIELFTGIHNGEIIIDDGSGSGGSGDDSEGTGGN